MTPREIGALRKVWRENVKRDENFYAGLQVTLHNAWFRGKQHPGPFKAEDFLGEAKPKGPPDWRRNKLLLGGILKARAEQQRREKALSAR